MLAGLVPAIILTLCNLAAAYWVAVKRGVPQGSVAAPFLFNILDRKSVV